MRKIYFLATVPALALALAACEGDNSGRHGDHDYSTNNVVAVDEDCPRPDGEPCR